MGRVIFIHHRDIETQSYKISQNLETTEETESTEKGFLRGIVLWV